MAGSGGVRSLRSLRSVSSSVEDSTDKLLMGSGLGLLSSKTVDHSECLDANRASGPGRKVGFSAEPSINVYELPPLIRPVVKDNNSSRPNTGLVRSLGDGVGALVYDNTEMDDFFAALDAMK